MSASSCDESVRVVPLEQQCAEVRTWLEEMYPERKVVEYEETDETIAYLYALMQKSKLAQQGCTLHRDDVLEETSRTKLATERMFSVLQYCGLTKHVLPEDDQQRVEVLSQMAQRLHLQHEVSTADYLAAISKLAVQKHTGTLPNQAEFNTAGPKETLNELHRLRGVIERLRTEEQARKAPITQALAERVVNTTKRRQYRETYALLAKQLQATPIDKEHTHASLVSQKKRTDDLQARIASLKKQLAPYGGLPTDIGESEALVVAARARLNQLDETFNQGILTQFESEQGAEGGAYGDY